MDKMTLEQAKELADLWRQMTDLREAITKSILGSDMNNTYYRAYEIILDRKEKLIQEIISG